MCRLLLTVPLVTLLLACSRGPEPETRGAEPVPETAPLQTPQQDSVRVLSYRAAELIGPMFQRFEAETGVLVELVVLPADAINAHVIAASEAEVPDLILSVDAIRFGELAEAGELRPLPAPVLARVPPELRDSDGLWLGLSYRLRGPLFAAGAPRAADWPELLQALPEHRVCNRPAGHVYNLGLVAWLLGAHGRDAAAAFVDAVLARPMSIEGGDRDQILGVLDGRCSLAFVNHYYLARLLETGSDTQRDALAKTQFGFGEGGEGLVGNVSALALTRRGRAGEAASRLADWLSSPSALDEHAELFAEFPADWPQTERALPAALRPMAGLAMAQPMPAQLYRHVNAARELIEARQRRD